ncbi:hypothetical protein ZWY2020_028096 [Hordeum vulgare]|nr:hypothetical protein ZWY2020_028096 [Hordeum vulgare]
MSRYSPPPDPASTIASKGWSTLEKGGDPGPVHQSVRGASDPNICVAACSPNTGPIEAWTGLASDRSSAWHKFPTTAPPEIHRARHTPPKLLLAPTISRGCQKLLLAPTISKSRTRLRAGLASPRPSMIHHASSQIHHPQRRSLASALASATAPRFTLAAPTSRCCAVASALLQASSRAGLLLRLQAAPRRAIAHVPCPKPSHRRKPLSAVPANRPHQARSLRACKPETNPPVLPSGHRRGPRAAPS